MNQNQKECAAEKTDEELEYIAYGNKKISLLVLTTGIPLMLSLLINSLYNFVDSVFVSRVAENALTGLSLASPVQIMVSALGLGNAVGLNAAISRALGEGRPDKVKKIASASIFLAVCAWVVISLACLIGVWAYFNWQSGGNAEIAASVTNLILDPVFIFGFGMGTRGAAIATVIGQHMGLLAGILINLRWNKEIEFAFTLHPDWPSIATILRVGIPAAWMLWQRESRAVLKDAP